MGWFNDSKSNGQPAFAPPKNELSVQRPSVSTDKDGAPVATQELINRVEKVTGVGRAGLLFAPRPSAEILDLKTRLTRRELAGIQNSFYGQQKQE